MSCLVISCNSSAIGLASRAICATNHVSTAGSRSSSRLPHAAMTSTTSSKPCREPAVLRRGATPVFAASACSMHGLSTMKLGVRTWLPYDRHRRCCCYVRTTTRSFVPLPIAVYRTSGSSGQWSVAMRLRPVTSIFLSTSSEDIEVSTCSRSLARWKSSLVIPSRSGLGSTKWFARGSSRSSFSCDRTRRRASPTAHRRRSRSN